MNNDMINNKDISQTMLDAMPMCNICLNTDLKGLACDEEAIRLFGLSTKQAYLDRFHELSPKYQLDGEVSAKLLLARWQRQSKQDGFVSIGCIKN